MSKINSRIERERRWRLILGDAAEDPQEGELGADPGGDGEEEAAPGSGDGQLSEKDKMMDRALESLYGDGESEEGDLGDADPDIARWLDDIRSYFPAPVAHVMQQDMLQKSNLRKLLADPNFLDYVEPDIALVSDILALRRVMPAKTRETAKRVVRQVVEALRQKLERPLDQALRGAIHRPTRNRRPKFNEINWKQTIHKNLRHYQPRERAIVPETVVGYGRRERGLHDLILSVDTSGSMSSSVVYASIYASVLASMPAVSTRLTLFSTSVVDLTDELDDPVELLFGIQLRGGTNIDKAVAYCEQYVERPNETTLVLITDLFEGGDREMLVTRLASLVNRGVQVVVLLALNDSGTPRFNRDLANQLVPIGIPSFACTPDHFPELMSAILNGRDIQQWATSAGIVTAPDN
ncbi:MAG: VWA domain-containing protein [Chloroflexota bacterium]